MFKIFIYYKRKLYIMARKKTYEERIQELQEKAPGYSNVKDFMKGNPYLYRWLLKHGVCVKNYFPRKIEHKKYSNRANKGINCYKVGSKKLYKHYDFVLDAIRDLDLTYYWIDKVLNGELPSVDGYYFERCKDKEAKKAPTE